MKSVYGLIIGEKYHIDTGLDGIIGDLKEILCIRMKDKFSSKDTDLTLDTTCGMEDMPHLRKLHYNAKDFIIIAYTGKSELEGLIQEAKTNTKNENIPVIIINYSRKDILIEKGKYKNLHVEQCDYRNPKDVERFIKSAVEIALSSKQPEQEIAPKNCCISM